MIGNASATASSPPRLAAASLFTPAGGQLAHPGGLATAAALGDLLEAGGAAQALGFDASQELNKLSGLLEGLPNGLDAVSLLRHPAWTDIMRTAAMAADLVGGEPG